MIEEWIQWQPIEGLESRYNLEALFENEVEWNIILTEKNNDKKKLKITFKSPVEAYRTITEGLRLVLLQYLGQRYGDNFYTQWSFFKVNNSEFTQWLSTQSYKTFDFLECVHFVIISDDVIIDIITNTEPHVTWVD